MTETKNEHKTVTYIEFHELNVVMTVDELNKLQSMLKLYSILLGPVCLTC